MTGTPESVAGGCLCGAIRYSILFPSGTPAQNPTCQCTRCRKFTGSLVPQLLTVPTANVQPALSSNASYKAYSVPANKRIFCGDCGSSIAYVSDKEPEVTEIHPGSLDEEVLCGKTAEGQPGKRIGGLGRDLCAADAHLWVGNAVPGITDVMEGKKWLGCRGDGEPFMGELKDLKDDSGHLVK